MQIRATLAAAAVIALLGVSPVSAQNYSYGWVTSNLSSNHTYWVQDSGAGYVRLNFYWSEIETSDDNLSWTDADNNVSQAVNAGLKIYASLSQTPDWARQDMGCSNTYGRCHPNLTAWYDFVYRVVDRYQYLGDDIVFGVWNEPNLNGFYSGTAASYGLLFAYASLARDAANSSAKLGGPEITSGAVDDGWFQSLTNNYFPSYHKAQDILTVHWYPDDPDPLMDTINDMNNLFPGREVWLTETGYSSCNDATQAQKISDIVTAFGNRTQSNFTKMFLYVMYEQPDGCGYNFGLFDFSTWMPRTGYYTYKSAIP